MSAFNPRRLSLARERRGLTKKELANAGNVVPRSITAFESGDLTPSTETLDRLASALAFPGSFFFLADPPELAADTASFRSLARMPASRRMSVLAAGTLATELNAYFEAHFALPEAELPDLRDEDPERAATALRAHWRLGDRPIGNMVHLLESKGVRVFSLVNESPDVDAFCVWNQKTPFVFLNTTKSGERGRFDAAHELGHLVLHRHGVPRGREAEAEADQFASAFLMPRGPILAAAPRLPTLVRLVGLKHTWKVSVAALARRLYSLDVMTQWQYDNICIDISRHGWRTNEPQSMARETSQLLQKTFGTLRDDGVTYRRIAEALHIGASDLNALVFGMLLHAVEGQSKATSRARRPALKLVT